MKKAEEKFRVALNASPSAMLIVGQYGLIEYANQAAERLFQYTHEQLTGKPVEMLLPQELREIHPKLCQGFYRNPEARSMGVGRDLLAQNAAGEVFPVEVGLNPITTQEGTVVLCAVVDLTERKKYEAKILEQKELLEQANKQLSEQVVTDSLTNLANRRHLMAKMEEYLLLADRTGECLSLIMADVDYFKQYNDSFGHPAGDEALQAVARELSQQSRQVDIVARYGGEEFSVLLPATDWEGAMAIAERIRAATARISHLHRAVTLSLGVATTDARMHSKDIQQQCSELTAQADRALYTSKQTGRNRVTHSKFCN